MDAGAYLRNRDTIYRLCTTLGRELHKIMLYCPNYHPHSVETSILTKSNVTNVLRIYPLGRLGHNLESPEEKLVVEAQLWPCKSWQVKVKIKFRMNLDMIISP